MGSLVVPQSVWAPNIKDRKSIPVQSFRVVLVVEFAAMCVMIVLVFGIEFLSVEISMRERFL